MNAPCFLVTAVLASITLGACSRDPNDGPFGPPEQTPLLAPFAGMWRFELDRTLNVRRANGASDADLEIYREFWLDPEVAAMPPDVSIVGNVVVTADVPVGEYRLFAIHEHGPKMCGMAWHHEDRQDPGDMARAYVRLSIDGDDLLMDVRLPDRGATPSDPLLRNQPPVESGSAATCRADNPPGPEEWDGWATFVYSRKSVGVVQTEP